MFLIEIFGWLTIDRYHDGSSSIEPLYIWPLLFPGETILEYVGCYNDGGPRDLPHHAATTDAMTPFLCVSTCRNLGFLFAGVQNENQCWCGNTFGGKIFKKLENGYMILKVMC